MSPLLGRPFSRGRSIAWAPKVELFDRTLAIDTRFGLTFSIDTLCAYTAAIGALHSKKSTLDLKFASASCRKSFPRFNILYKVIVIRSKWRFQFSVCKINPTSPNNLGPFTMLGESHSLGLVALKLISAKITTAQQQTLIVLMSILIWRKQNLVSN